MLKVLVFYDYFDPAFKAGGPIRSLVNLVRLMEDEIDFSIITSNTDHDNTVLPVKKLNRWIPYGKKSQVAYLDKEHRNQRFIDQLLEDVAVHMVYINGVFSLFTTILPLRLSKKRGIPVIIAPRGMLQVTSLSIRPLKKKVYMWVLKNWMLHDSIIWHVTTKQEADDFNELFPRYGNQLYLTGNVPFFLKQMPASAHKNRQKRVLGTVAVISPMKNIHLVIEALGKQRKSVRYEIYGPVKDESYWNECRGLIDRLPDNVEVIFQGTVRPEMVYKVMQRFDFYIQPSKSENFGHSIFEAFNLGIPVITSDRTPWKGLNVKKAGWDVSLTDPQSLISSIGEAMNLSDSEYMSYSHGARKVAEDYMEVSKLREKYLELFGCAS
ncbi:MAG: glycosyltransferase [Bacteroidota bacterium]